MSGGIWYHNATGAARLDAPREPAGTAAEDAAWDAYLTHVRGCTGCHTRLHNCETGRGLWQAYTAARGPLAHPAAWAAS